MDRFNVTSICAKSDDNDVTLFQISCGYTENMSDPRWNMLFLLFVTLICDSISVNTIPDYITENGLLGHCDSTITNKEDVYIRSHTGAYQLGSAINYGANENCKLTFEAGTGNTRSINQNCARIFTCACRTNDFKIT